MIIEQFPSTYQGISQAGAPSSLTLAAGASTVADAYKGLELYIASGTGAGQSRNVVSSRKNLHNYSQDFSNVAWTKQICTATPSAGIAPDGTNTATLLTTTAGTGNPTFDKSYAATPGAHYISSFYAKKGSAGYAYNIPTSDAGDYLWVTWDLTTGNVVSTGGPNVNVFLVQAFPAIDVGGGWWRCSMELYILSGSLIADQIGLSLTANAGYGTYTGGDTIYLWGAQAQPSVLSEYIHTIANPAVGAIIDTPWTTVPDSTSVYEISLTTPANQMLMADLLTITLKDGSVSYLTSSDVNITYGGHTYLSNSIQFQRSKIKSVVGVKVDSLDLSLYGDSTTLIVGNHLKLLLCLVHLMVPLFSLIAPLCRRGAK